MSTPRVLAWSSVVVAMLLVVGRELILRRPHPELLQTQTTGNPLLSLVAIFAFPIVGAIIVSLRPRHPIGWMYCATGILIALSGAATAWAQLGLAMPGTLPLVDTADAIGGFTFFGGFALPVTYGLLLFPDGHLPSPRWRIVAYEVAVAYAVVMAGNAISAAGDEAGSTIGLLGLLGLISGILASAAALVGRWRRARAAEREQLKWVGAAAAALGLTLLALIVRETVGTAVGLVGSLDDGVDFVVFSVAFCFIPIAVGIAILRYRLYDIDVLINRALVYGATTAAIAVAFFGGIVILEALLGPITSGSGLAVAVSTFLSFALFQPLRRRVQDAVDRRFYRSRYDAARTLDAFSRRLRDEVDLDAVRAELVSAVCDTVQPEHASLWLRATER
jgi:hypothetical protein